MTWKTWKNHGFHLLCQFVRLPICARLLGSIPAIRFIAVEDPTARDFADLTCDSDGKLTDLDLRDVKSVLETPLKARRTIGMFLSGLTGDYGLCTICSVTYAVQLTQRDTN